MTKLDELKKEADYWAHLEYGSRFQWTELRDYVLKIPKLISIIEKQRECIEFAHRWALDKTPTIRPYDLCDHMSACIAKADKMLEDA